MKLVITLTSILYLFSWPAFANQSLKNQITDKADEIKDLVPQSGAGKGKLTQAINLLDKIIAILEPLDGPNDDSDGGQGVDTKICQDFKKVRALKRFSMYLEKNDADSDSDESASMAPYRQLRKFACGYASPSQNLYYESGKKAYDHYYKHWYYENGKKFSDAYYKHIYFDNGSKYFDNSYKHYFYPNGKKIYDAYYKHWHYPSGQKYYDAYYKHIYYKNGQKYYDAYYKHYYYPNGKKAYDAYYKKWYYPTGASAGQLPDRVANKDVLQKMLWLAKLGSISAPRFPHLDPFFKEKTDSMIELKQLELHIK